VTASIDLLSAATDQIAQEGAERRRQLPRRKTWRPASELAVDLGTANTLVLVKGEGVVLNEPSVAAVDQATGNIMGIGLEAKRMLGREAAYAVTLAGCGTCWRRCSAPGGRRRRYTRRVWNLPPALLGAGRPPAPLHSPVVEPAGGVARRREAAYAVTLAGCGEAGSRTG
jgi:hypothetical protein